MTPLTKRTRLLTALAVIAAAVAVAGPGYHPSRSRMRSGAVWLTSTATGEATLVDGASAEVAARVPVDEPGAVLRVTQQGAAALVLNQDTGVLTRVDSATLKVSRSEAVLPRGRELAVKAARNVVHSVDLRSGTVVSIDPETLRPKEKPGHLAEALRPDGVEVDSRGRLWAIDDTTGDLVWLTDGERRTRSASAGSGHLTMSGDRPVLVNPRRGTAELLDPETGAVARSARADLRAGDSLAVSGSADRPRLLIATETRGELIACTFDTGSCATPVHISATGAALGAPVEVGDLAVVPDFSTGQATIVDLAASRVIARRQLFDRPTRFELVARDGFVFFNDPNSNAAGVLGLTGDVRSITKYAEMPAEDTSPSTPDPHAQAGQVKKADHQKQQPDRGLPWLTDRRPQAIPAPPAPQPAVSILVTPRGRAVAGDERELELVPQPSGAATISWSFGDGTEAVGATVRHSWRQPGVFTVRATATLDSGASERAETAVAVDPEEAPPAIAQLIVRRPKPVIGESVHFSADSTGKPDTWTWTVTKPDGSTPEFIARTTEFDHRFATPGTYTVSLTIGKGTRTAHSTRRFTVGRGVVKAWGDDNFGHVLEVPDSAASGVVAIAAGDYHALALKSDGSVIAWGDDEYGQAAVPPEAQHDVIAIAGGNNHSLALKSDGSVIAWGYNGHGQATVSPEAEHDVIAIAGGHSHSLALRSDGSVVAWGHDEFHDQAVVPPTAKSGVIAIAAGSFNSVALKVDGSIVVWGWDGNGSKQIPPEASGGGLAVSAGYGCCMVLKTDGSVVGWGHNEVAEVPPAGKSGVIAISNGSIHCLALKADGTAVAWGWIGHGEGAMPPQYNHGVLAVAAGEEHSMVVLEDLG